MLKHGERKLEELPGRHRDEAEGGELDEAAPNAGLFGGGSEEAVETVLEVTGRLPLPGGDSEGAAPLQGELGRRHPTSKL